MAFIMPLQLQAQTYDAPVNVTEGSTYVRYMANVKITAERPPTQVVAEANAIQRLLEHTLQTQRVAKMVDVTIEFSNDLKNGRQCHFNYSPHRRYDNSRRTQYGASGLGCI